MARFTSRKFLLTVLVLVGAAAVVVGGGTPEATEAVVERMLALAERVGAIIAAGAVVWRYIKTEGELDALK